MHQAHPDTLFHLLTHSLIHTEKLTVVSIMLNIRNTEIKDSPCDLLIVINIYSKWCMHFHLFSRSLYKKNMFNKIQVTPKCQEHSPCLKFLGTIETGIKFYYEFSFSFFLFFTSIPSPHHHSSTPTPPTPHLLSY